jgi:hypothetical protein
MCERPRPSVAALSVCQHMSRFPFIAVTLMVAFLIMGCFPVRFTRSPGVSGVVHDSQTRAPVCGAKVVISPIRYGSNLINAASVHAIAQEPGTARRLPAATDRNGRFSVPPLREWTTWNPIWFSLADLKEVGGILIVYQEGYEPAAVDVHTTKKRLTLVNPVLLRPVPK